MGVHVRIFPQENISLPEQCQNVSNESFLAIFFLCGEFNQSLTMGQNSFVKQSQTSLSRTLREKKKKESTTWSLSSGSNDCFTQLIR